ncbi:MAG: cytochrome c oxidase subunit I [Gammaproteobacteria bacterium]
MTARRPENEELRRRLGEIWGSPPGLGRLSAVNHTPIGQRYIVTAFVLFLVGGVLAMLMRAQLAWHDGQSLDHETYNQLFTMHGTTMMFLFAVPMLEGLAVYLVPKMIGARDLPFPRLGAFTYWCYLFGAIILYSSFFFGAVPDAGWFMYTPLSSKPYSPGKGVDFWLLGITFIEISAVLAAIELVVAILKTRAPGMAIHRMPLFVWTVLVAALMIVFGFPPLILGGILLELERAFGLPFYDPTRGGHSLLWQHLFWFFGHPEVYIIFLPAAGIVSMVVSTFARIPIVGYVWLVLAAVATGFISFMLWVHHMFTTGIPLLALSFFSAASMAVVIPNGIQVFAWITTLWRGRPVLEVPLLFVLGFFFIFVLGGLTGVMLAVVPFDWQVHDTHFVVAHFHYVLIGGMLFPLLAGLYYWLPLHTGRRMSAPLGRWAFWLLFIGFNVTFLPMHLTGLLGMPRRVYTYPEGLGWEYLNAVSTVGGFLLTAAVAVFLIDLVLHFRFGQPAGRNPWNAGTLEWGVPVPVAPYTFVSQPLVQDRDPLWRTAGLAERLDQGRGFLGEARADKRETLVTGILTGEPEHVAQLPGSSWVPLHAALALAVMFVGVLAGMYLVAALGVVLAIVVGLRWLWDTDRGATVRVDVGRGMQLPTRGVPQQAPARWFLVIGLLAQATVVGSLVFAYLFLWTVSPAWPPPPFEPPPAGAATAALVLLLASAAAIAWVRRRIGHGGSRVGLAIAALLALGYAVLEVGALLAWGAPAKEHVYPALVYTLAGLQGVQWLAALLLGGLVWRRLRRAVYTEERPLAVHLFALYWYFVVATGVVVYAVIHLSPYVI